MVRQTARIILLEIAAGIALIVLLGLAVLGWRITSGPTDISLIKPQIEEALSAARDGRSVELGELQLAWRSEERRIALIAHDIRLYTSEGVVAAEAETGLIDLHMVSLLQGRFELDSFDLFGGSIEVVRQQDGNIQVAGDIYTFTPPPEGTWLEVANHAVTNLFSSVSAALERNDIQRVSYRDFRLRYVDEPLGLDWVSSNAFLGVRSSEGEVVLSGEGRVTGEGAPEELYFAFASGERFTSSLFSVNARGVPVSDLVPDNLKQALDTESSADVLAHIRADVDTGLRSVDVTFEIPTGTVIVGGETLNVDQARLNTVIDLGAPRVDVALTANRLGQFQGDLELAFPEAGPLLRDPFTGTHGYRLAMDRASLDLRPFFEQAWDLRSIASTGTLDLDAGTLRFASLTGRDGDATVSARGELYWKGRGVDDEGALPIGTRLTALSEGEFTVDQVLAYWPPSIGEGARNWVAENVQQGNLRAAEFQLDLKPTSLVDEVFDNEELVLNFAFEDAVVGFLSDLPPVTSGRGTATLFGNAFRLQMTGGQFGTWDLSDGTVGIDYFKPKGGLIRIDVDGTGDVSGLVDILNRSRLRLEANGGLPANAVSGTGALTFTLERPALSDVSYDDTRFAVTGRIEDAGIDGLINELDLNDATVAVDLDNDRLVLNGYGALDAAPVRFAWTEQFREGAAVQSALTASGVVTPDVLNRFGIAARAYMSGEAAVDVTTTGSGRRFETADVRFDLSEARIDASEIGWLKPKGEPAAAQLNYRDLGSNRTVAFDLSHEALDLQGDVSLDAGGKLDRFTLSRARVPDRIDVNGAVTRSDAETLRLELGGAFLNAEPFIGDLMSLGGGAPTFGKLEVSADIEQLRLRQGMTLSDARMEGKFAGPQLELLEISGETQNGDRLDIAVDQDPEGRRLTLVGGDAGFLVQGLFGGTFLRGGAIEVQGLIRPRGQPSTYDVRVEDAQLADAPLLTQVLSLASLQGLADVLSGDGVRLTDIEIPLTVTEDRYAFAGARASGPAIGVTANGWVSLSRRQIDVRGVLVPSFGVNSALGGIPIIGDLFVSREGEGVFAINYYVRGAMEDASIGVNPFSAITPGVLRRIFESPAGAEIPEVPAVPDD